MMGYTFGLGLFTGRRMAAPVSASVVTLSVQPQDGENIAVSYTVTAGTTCAAVLYQATEATPGASDFDGGGAPAYRDLGTVALTVDGDGISLTLPDDLNGSYKLALLPDGGGDADVAESGAITLDTYPPVLIEVTQIAEAQAQTGSGGGKSFFGGVDLSAYPAGTDILILTRDGDASAAVIGGLDTTHLTSGAVHGGGIYAHAFVVTLPAQGASAATMVITRAGNSNVFAVSVYAIENGTVNQVDTSGASASTGDSLTVTPTHANNVILALSTVNSGTVTTNWSANITETFEGASNSRNLSLARADGVPVAPFTATTTLSASADAGAVLISISEV